MFNFVIQMDRADRSMQQDCMDLICCTHLVTS